MSLEFWIFFGLTFGVIGISVLFHNLISKISHDNLKKNIEKEIIQLKEKQEK